MLFEEQPAILIVLIILIVEVWLRVREPLFSAITRLFNRRSAT